MKRALATRPSESAAVATAEARRRQMIRAIESDVLEVSGLIGKAALDFAVMDAMVRVPRHEFVPREEERLAYINHALPIGHRQTISQPFIVALMTDLLAVGKDDVVLEVGTGSGYQAAVLAELVQQVYSIESIETLAEEADSRLARLGYDNVKVRWGNGCYGWPEHAPFDGIIVTAAPEEIPGQLVEQLATGRRMVIPLGSQNEAQWLTVVEKESKDRISEREVLAVSFVPLIH